MNFKVHLIIVSFIIVAVYLAWQLTSRAPAPVPAVQQTGPKLSPYSIIITHASWGLNCRFRVSTTGEATSPDTFVNKDIASSDKVREDNVLMKVSEICNGKAQCSIPLTPDALGGDPLPECPDKNLEVEYRCFSFDRPWTVRASQGALNIDCSKTAGKE